MIEKLPFTYVPVESEAEIVCNEIKCAAGLGLAGRGQCFLKGDPYDKNCIKYISDDDFIKEYQDD